MEKGDSVDAKSPGANPLSVAVVHDDETGIAEGAMLGPRSGAYFGAENPEPNLVVAADVHDSVGNCLLRAHGTLDQALGIQVGMVVPL